MTDKLIDDEFFDDIVASPVAKGRSAPVPKTRRGLNARSQWLVQKMKPIVEAAQPITGRGVGYKLFVARLVKSMSVSEMQRVYRLLKEARERGIIPWEHIVDETRQLERAPSWRNPKAFAESAARQYRRDF